MKTRTPSGNEDVNFFRCIRCGFPCDLSRDKIVSGTGLVYTAISHAEQAAAPDDHTVRGGCPQCGKGDYTRTY